MKSNGPDDYEYDEDPDENPRGAAAKKILDTEFPEAEHEGPEDIESYLRSKTRYEEGE